MSKVILFLLLLIYSSCLIAQDAGWVPSKYQELESKVWKVDGKIKYFVDSTMNISLRNEIIHKTKEYIADNLRFINESSYDDSLYLVIIRDQNEIKKYVGRTSGGTTITKNDFIPNNYIFTIYSKEYNPLKHELMHLVCYDKWGDTCGAMLYWLSEGLAMLADPDLDNIECRTFEEKYVYFLQNNMLLSTKDLIFSMHDFEMPQTKISYAQSAYIVEYLIKNYGMTKVRLQWNKPMDCFEEIFGLTFDDLILKINKELNQKYPNPIDLEWEKFSESCIL